jgi:hypothetical protein
LKARRANVVAEGLVAGILAHLAIALVLVVADLAGGRWFFYTPTLVGRVLLEGSRECQASPSAIILLAYTSIHLVVLSLFGMLASWLVSSSEERPGLWFGALFVFIFVAWHLPAAVLGVLGGVLECRSLWPPTIAGFAGALAMAVYLWRSHPRLRKVLRGDRYA